MKHRHLAEVEEQLALLPFNMTDLGGFKNIRTLAPGAAILFADGDDETAIGSATVSVKEFLPDSMKVDAMVAEKGPR